jgi:hypothetical protein
MRPPTANEWNFRPPLAGRDFRGRPQLRLL